MSSLRYPESTSHAPYCIVILTYPDLQYSPHILIINAIFEKVIERKMRVLIFSTNFDSKISHSIKKLESYM